MKKEDRPPNRLALVDQNETPIKVKTVDNKEDFVGVFKSFYKEARDKNYKLIIERYEHLSRNIDLLQQLAQDVLFKVQDFPTLDAASIPILINHIQLERSAFGQKIKQRLEDRRKAGLEIGNPEIAKHAKDSAVKQRIRLALFDAANIRAAREIFRLKAAGESFNAIADRLNQMEIPTRRGGRFYAKSVERIYNRYLNIGDNFVPVTKLEKQAAALDGSLAVSEMVDNYEYEDQLDIQVNTQGKEAVLKIYNWESEALLEHSFPAGGPAKQNWSLSVTNARELLPGTHYLVLMQGDKRVFLQRFYVAQSLLQIVRASAPELVEVEPMVDTPSDPEDNPQTLARQ